MNLELTKEQRHEIYKCSIILMKEYRKKNYYVSICSCVFYSLNFIGLTNHKYMDFLKKEIFLYAPLGVTDGYFFILDEDGYNKRMEILKKLIDGTR